MIDAILGFSIALNFVAFGILIYKLRHREPQQTNIYAGIEDVMRDDEWDRIGTPPPPPPQNPHTFVAACGRREKIER